MQLSHTVRAISATFDEPNLIASAGLVPAVVLADRVGIAGLAEQWVTVPGSVGAHAGAKVMSLVAGMTAGAGCISDMGVLRHGAMGAVFTEARAPSTLGTFLRSFTFGHVRQLDAVATRTLVALARTTPLLPGIDQRCLIDIDDTIERVYGRRKQGAAFGYTRVRGLNAQLATISTETAAPVLAATRLRKGNRNSGHGAARMIADAVATARRCGAAGEVLVRADSAYFNRAVVAAIRTAGARFSVTIRQGPAVQAAIASIDEGAWTRIQYPWQITDPDTGELIDAAEVAEIEHTVFTSKPRYRPVTARLIVRRVPERNTTKLAGQDPMFPLFRYHALFTDSTRPLIDAEAEHRGHAIIEHVIADLKNSALANLPSGKFTANAAWLACAAIAFNLTRALGVAAGGSLAKAETATIRARVINIPARAARSARRLHLHLPRDWLWESLWLNAWRHTTSAA